MNYALISANASLSEEYGRKWRLGSGEMCGDRLPNGFQRIDADARRFIRHAERQLATTVPAKHSAPQIAARGPRLPGSRCSRGDA